MGLNYKKELHDSISPQKSGRKRPCEIYIFGKFLRVWINIYISGSQLERYHCIGGLLENLSWLSDCHMFWRYYCLLVGGWEPGKIDAWQYLGQFCKTKNCPTSCLTFPCTTHVGDNLLLNIWIYNFCFKITNFYFCMVLITTKRIWGKIVLFWLEFTKIFSFRKIISLTTPLTVFESPTQYTWILLQL